jgi:ABC-type lipoprotein release transport system permease subunit
VKVSFFLALKNILSKKRLFAMTVLIIALSFVSITFTSAMIAGVTEVMNNQLIDKMYGNIAIEPKEGDLYIDDVDVLLEKIRSVPGVEGAAPRYLLGGNFFKDGKPFYAGFGFIAIDPVEEKKVTNVYMDVSRGEYFTEKSRGELLLGTHISGGHEQYIMPEDETLGAEIGDRFKAAIGTDEVREFRIKGIVNPRDIYAVMHTYLTIDDAEEILGVENKASAITVKVEKGTEKEYVNKFRELGISEEIRTWEEKAGSTATVISMFSVIDYLLTGIGLIIVFVIIFVVTYISIIHKRRQIGILKSIGIDSRVIILSYVTQSTIYGLVGILIGRVSSELLIGYFTVNPVDMIFGFMSPILTIQIVILASTMILVSSLIGGFLPSFGASRKNIIKLIWG